MPVTLAEYRATAVLLAMFVVTMVMAVLMAGPFSQAGLQAFEDPDDPLNAVYYIALLLVFTFAILWVYKRGHKWVIQVLILGAVASAILYGFIGVGAYLGLTLTQASLVGLGVGSGSAIWLWRNPEWYVIDIVGLLVAASAAALLGISLGIVPTVILLVGLAIYDAIAVYKTKHMLDLADAVIERRLPVLLVIPKGRGYSFKREAAAFRDASKANKGQREAMFMGLGDLVMPTILVVSAFAFIAGPPLSSLEAHAGQTEAAGDLAVDLHATVLDQGSIPVTVVYRIEGQEAMPTARWTLDWDFEAGPEAQGVGLPASVAASYGQEGLLRVIAHVQDGQAEGTAEMRLEVSEPGPWYNFLADLAGHPSALGAALGTLVGFLVLMAFVLRGNPQAGLPLLNGGALTGFLVGLWASTGSIVFW